MPKIIFKYHTILLLFAILFCVQNLNAQVWIKTKNKPVVKKKTDDWEYSKQKQQTQKPEDESHVKPIGTVQLTASFVMNKREVCPTDSVKFTYKGNAKSYPDVFYNWQMPDSSTYNETSPGVIFVKVKKPGVYKVSIRVTGDEEQFRTSRIYSDSFEVLTPPDASFSIEKKQVCKNEQVYISYQGNKKIAESYTNFSWSFDGGFPLTEKNSFLQKVFWDVNCKGRNVIMKTVKLTTTNQAGCTSVSKQRIRVIAPDAQIDLSNEHPCNGEKLKVKAITCAKDANTQYIWDFGSGIDANPSKIGGEQDVVYYNITDYPTSDMIKLQVIQEGCYSNIDSVFLDIYPLILADFTVSKDTLLSGNTITFNVGDVFTCDGGGKVEYQWKFPEGKVITSNQNRELSVKFTNSYGSAAIVYPSLSIIQDKCKSRPFTLPIYLSSQSGNGGQ